MSPDKPQSTEDAVTQDGPLPADETAGRVVDPSDAVTGLGFVFGAAGAVFGAVGALILSPAFSAAALVHCLIGALAGGSAGIVTGGMVGALLAVARGTTRPPEGRRSGR